MAIITPPAWLQAGTYAARTDRLSVITGLLGYHGSSADEGSLRTRGGVRPSYQQQQLAVSAQATPNMTVQVSAGIAYVQNKDLANYGAYTVVNDATVNLTIAASSGSQYRKDSVCVQVLDAETLGTVNSASLLVVQGPYAASAGATTRGTIPPNSVVLADIAVDAGVASITSAKITDARQFQVASGGVLPVVSTAVPDHPAPGQVMYLTDTSVLRYGKSDGSTRQIMTDEQLNPGAWTPFTPTWSSLGGTQPSLGNGTLTSRWCRVGFTIHWAGKLVIGSTTGGGSGLWFMSLPVPQVADGITRLGPMNYVAAGNNYIGEISANPADSNRATFVVKDNNGAATAGNVSASSPLAMASGYTLLWNLTYEAAS
ncbi:unknown [Streptomyces phage mu1/6]|uniref:hypothetical protein n=1 Tax=Streptomyces phage mu1/6 TaxID=370623 RepID=UPI0000D4F6DD|nr:hypothetical protein SPMV1_gp47 [Streptomyces phage mu1/6]ABD94212.1 unknown [Streptomyces phage mu1/6]